MTESEWLTCTDPAAMLAHLQQHAPLSERKLRLFACACCRQIWQLLTDERSRRAVEVAEQYADGRVTEEDVKAADEPALNAAVVTSDVIPADVAWALVTYSAPRAAEQVIEWTLHFADNRDVQADLLRDIAGNPFRPLTLPRGRRTCPYCEGKGSWSIYKGPGATNAGFRGCYRCDERGWFEDLPCPWLTSTVLTLAQAAYDHRDDNGRLDNVRMKVLADAIEEAGLENERCKECGSTGKVEYCSRWMFSCAELGVDPCTCNSKKICEKCNGEGGQLHPILAHLRSEEAHVRGCAALDEILGLQ